MSEDTSTNINDIKHPSLLRRALSKLYQLAREKAPPRRIARGLALGIFVGLLPIMGIQMAVVTILALPLRGSIKAAILGVWVSNPITFLPMYWGYYQFGLLFTSTGRISSRRFRNIITEAAEWDWSNLSDSVKNIVDLGSDILIPMWTGSVILAVFFSIITYFATYRFVVSYRERMARRKERSTQAKSDFDHG